MTDHDAIDAYIKLFRGRGDAVGTWQGGSRRCNVIREDFTNHLLSNNPAEWMGTYPHLGSRGVSWGCIDIDGKDFQISSATDVWDWPKMLDLGRKLQAVLAFKSVHAHLEQTRNGYHVWVFPEAGIVPARFMRRALMAACKACSYDPKEVNPKSEDLLPSKLGNYVRLPYYGALCSNEHQVDRFFIDDEGAAMTLQEFLATVSQLWTPPAVQTFDGPPPEELEPVIATLSGLTYTIWKDGPLEGRDRSNTLAKLAYRLHDDGQSMPNAFAVVKDGDRRWGKFADRPDCDEQIMNIVQRAYTE